MRLLVQLILCIGLAISPAAAVEWRQAALWGGDVRSLSIDPSRPERPSGPLTSEALADAIGATLPDHAIVVDEANTSGISIPAATVAGPPHDWLCLTGGSIGIGLPLATGAAIGAPDRRVVAIQADGSAMYTFQALWTMARENLDVTILVFSNQFRKCAFITLLRAQHQLHVRIAQVRNLAGIARRHVRARCPGCGH